MATNQGEVGRAVRRDSPWWTDPSWSTRDRDLRQADSSGLGYDPLPLDGLVADGLYLLYGPRRAGKTVAIKRVIKSLLASGVDPRAVVRVSVDGWKANRLGMLHDYVTRVATTSLESGRRYWFIDEITATQGEWWSVIKDLRDNTSMGDDCVVLTGSSNRHLDLAIKAFAGRRGQESNPDRCLLPMTFRDFCASLGMDRAFVPPVRPDEIMGLGARDVWQSLIPYTDDLVNAWQAYLDVGGYPRAVSDWKARNNVDPSTWGAIWDVVRGETATEAVNESTVSAIMSALARRLTSTVAIRPMAQDVGVRYETLERRLDALEQAFLVWRCPAADAHGRPDPRRQSKFYFIDPLVARLPELTVGSTPVDITHLNEQQLGMALVAWNERSRSGSIRSGSWIVHYRTGQTEIDFTGRCADNGMRMTAIDGKYSSGSWRREGLSIRNSTIGKGVLATRDILSVDLSDNVWAIPASFIAYAVGQHH